MSVTGPTSPVPPIPLVLLLTMCTSIGGVSYICAIPKSAQLGFTGLHLLSGGLHLGQVVFYACADERFECGFVERVTLVEVDSPRLVALQLSIEELVGVGQTRAFSEGQSDPLLQKDPDAYDPVVLEDGGPHRVAGPPPFHFLDDFRVGLVDDPAQVRQGRSAPIGGVCDHLIDVFASIWHASSICQPSPATGDETPSRNLPAVMASTSSA